MTLSSYAPTMALALRMRFCLDVRVGLRHIRREVLMASAHHAIRAQGKALEECLDRQVSPHEGPLGSGLIVWLVTVSSTA
ncbi:hypothetical protein EJ03DRAFT_122651 [Teratosphaeria nubilosa]|uniref:Uncharacterized protein n=1 Tax=Teratosphaeria nubilosa TaxID=161662 RepID=A0A6G1L5L5_9PEZI|nr:hypothetical protein EJ03DRAFT_122651 [Teratosphaeria nubilosa]